MENKSQEQTLSWKTILRITGMVLLLLFCWYFKQIIIVFIGALVLATSLEGLIQISQKIFKNRFISVLVVYVVLLVLMGLLIYAIMPLLINNFIDLINDFPTLLQRPEISNIINNFISENIITSQWLNTQNIITYIKDLTANIGLFFSKFTDILLMLLISFYISLDNNWFKNLLGFFAPKKYRKYIVDLWEKSKNKMIFWLYSQILISGLIGIITFISLYILGAKYALLAGLIHGCLEFIPFIGPIIASVLILIMNINIAPITWFGILLTLIIIQYIENIVSPIIRGKILKINPLVIIFAITVGAKLGGILGIFIAIPLSTILVTFFKDLSCLKSPDEPWCEKNNNQTN